MAHVIVEKYGGTSVADCECISKVAAKVCHRYQQGERIVVVVSAMGHETDRLADLGRSFAPSSRSREYDVLLSSGEQITISLLAMAIQQLGYSAISYTGTQAQIVTDDRHGVARIKSINAAKLHESLDAGNIVIVAGFQGVDEDGNITTLGRGGSDTSAVALAIALQAAECRIYTDVEGIYTADPRIVESARALDVITFEEMLEFASLGAKVLQTRAVELAGKYRIPLRILSTYGSGPGTLITYEENNHMEKLLISGITAEHDEAKLTVRGIPDQPGVAFRVLQPIAKANINVDMIIQNNGEDGLADLTFTVNRDNLEESLAILQSHAEELGTNSIIGSGDISKISIIGIGMRSHTGVATSMFHTLASEGINIELISTSEIKISVAISSKYTELALRSLHSAFGLDATDQTEDTLGISDGQPAEQNNPSKSDEKPPEADSMP